MRQNNYIQVHSSWSKYRHRFVIKLCTCYTMHVCFVPSTLAGDSSRDFPTSCNHLLLCVFGKIIMELSTCHLHMRQPLACPAGVLAIFVQFDRKVVPTRNFVTHWHQDGNNLQYTHPYTHPCTVECLHPRILLTVCQNFCSG